MDQALNDFAKRQKAVRRKHVRMANGYVTKLDRNGVFIQQPDNKAGGFAFQLLLLLVVSFLGFKTLLVTYLGEEAYRDTLAQLSGETMYERVGAYLMQLDPVTSTVAGLIIPYLP